MTRQEIMKTIQDQNVNFFRLQFVDIFGFMKNVALILPINNGHFAKRPV